MKSLVKTTAVATVTGLLCGVSGWVVAAGSDAHEYSVYDLVERAAREPERSAAGQAGRAGPEYLPGSEASAPRSKTPVAVQFSIYDPALLAEERDSRLTGQAGRAGPEDLMGGAVERKAGTSAETRFSAYDFATRSATRSTEASGGATW